MRAQLSLRERKKLQAMRRIQEVALELFDEYGYSNVTIERIAAEAEVSPSSVYRYFGTKEYVVLYDEYDPVAVQSLDDEFAAQDPVAALRRVTTDMVEELESREVDLVRRRMRYAMTEPDVRAGMGRQVEQITTEIRGLLAKHTGRDPGDLDVRVLAAALVSVFMTAIEYWHDTDYREPLHTVLDRALDVIDGITLDRPRG
ncbi:TetR family transcriptional regulator [Haloactinopolyspora alba]|uniref:TetR family transcriptional regulator n=1 Tax=Haloactinopolyspora alba TaxID=648780 RepID=A0A2P8E747_9ACTN|nr:TetR family transcriptional regulator [Haloactinopolyspora alba]PSL05292.1 TetR family transcriptional regulator [Haloactinopolyspora alba]